MAESPSEDLSEDPSEEPAWFNDDAGLRDAALERRMADTDVGDLIPVEWAAVSLVDRMRGSLGQRIDLTLVDGATAAGAVTEVGDAWVLLEDDVAQTLVALAAVCTIRGLGPPAPKSPTRLLGPSVVWREWARWKAPARWAINDGRVISASVFRVGKDALDLVEHPLDRAPTRTDPRVVLPASAVRWACAPNRR